MAVGTNLKQILKAKGMTIKQLAEVSGVSVNTIYGITRKDSSNVHKGTLEKLANALELYPGDLVFHEFARHKDLENKVEEIIEQIKEAIEASTSNHEYNMGIDYFLAGHVNGLYTAFDILQRAVKTHRNFS